MSIISQTVQNLRTKAKAVLNMRPRTDHKKILEDKFGRSEKKQDPMVDVPTKKKPAPRKKK